MLYSRFCLGASRAILYGLVLIGGLPLLAPKAHAATYTGTASAVLTVTDVLDAGGASLGMVPAGVTFSPAIDPANSCGAGSPSSPTCPAVAIGNATAASSTNAGSVIGVPNTFGSGFDFITMASGSANAPPSFSQADSSAFLGGLFSTANTTTSTYSLVLSLAYSWSVAASGNAGAGGGINVSGTGGTTLFTRSFPSPDGPTGAGTQQFTVTLGPMSSGQPIGLGVGVGGGALATPEPGTGTLLILGFVMASSIVRKLQVK